MADSKRLQDLSEGLLGIPYEALSEVQRSVIDLIASEAPSLLAPGLQADDRTFWDRLADNVAKVGGSWNFIFGFGAGLFLWIGWNLINLHTSLAFDPYPFIFLNLLLSMLAAIQAPVIMMSQNRAAVRDREAAEHDYRVNLRAELEIMHLHDKLDAVRNEQMLQLLARQDETLILLRAQLEGLGGKPA